MKFKSVRTKILAGFGIVIFLVILLAFINNNALKYVNDELEEVTNEELTALINDEELAFYMSQRLAIVRAYVLYDDARYLDQYDEYTEHSHRLEAVHMEMNQGDERSIELIEKSTEWEQLVIDEVFTPFDHGNEALALTNLSTKVEPLSREMMDTFQELAAFREEVVVDRTSNMIDTGESTILYTLIISGVIVIFSLVIGFITSNTITNPIKVVMERMNAIASGDLGEAALKTKSVDEIGQLVTSTNEMNLRMRELLEQISTVSRTLSNQSEELTLSANEVSQGSEQVASTMEELASGSEMEADTTSDLSAMMNTFSDKVQEANENGKNIEKYSNEVMHMTTEGSETMNKSTAQMAHIDEIVREAVEKVDGLDSHTQEISEIVSVIEDIADQTNLLALNAAIEAARAGEHGQGFAVVADEVRKLAEQSSDSVQNITNIIHNIQGESASVSQSLQGGYEEVEAGIHQIRATGETFNDISAAVSEMVTNIQHVTQNLTDIAQDSKQMNDSIQDIAAITEQSAAGIEETSASSEQTSAAMSEVTFSSNELAKLADELNTLVNRFKL